MITPRTFLIDFDGTISKHDYPYIHEAAPHAVRVLHRMADAGHRLILHTMRHGEEMDHAKAWLKDHDLFFDEFNRNSEMETGSRKVYGHWMIDDHGIGCPVIHDTTIHYKPFVDWLKIEQILEEKGLL